MTAAVLAVLGGEAAFCLVVWYVARCVVRAFGAYAVEDRKVSDLILQFVTEAERLRREISQVRESVEIALAERQAKPNGHQGAA